MGAGQLGACNDYENSSVVSVLLPLGDDCLRHSFNHRSFVPVRERSSMETECWSEAARAVCCPRELNRHDSLASCFDAHFKSTNAPSAGPVDEVNV